MNRNDYEETDSRLDASAPHAYEAPKTDYNDVAAQRNYILTGLQSMSDACEDGQHGQCHHALHDICKCECHKAPAAEDPKQDDFDNGYDFERDEELQAEIDADAAMNDEIAEQEEEAAIAASIEEEKRAWGGARAGAGRPEDSAKAETREPLYQAGYQAGYHAGQRTKKAYTVIYSGISHRPYTETFENEEAAERFAEQQRCKGYFADVAAHLAGKPFWMHTISAQVDNAGEMHLTIDGEE